MDHTFLVTKGQKLVELLDATPVKPQAALWVHSPDNDRWKLWIVPDRSMRNKRAFYQIVAETIGASEYLTGLDASSTEFVHEEHPAIQSMRKTIRVSDTSEIHFSANMLNGYYLPESIVLRMDGAKQSPAAA